MSIPLQDFKWGDHPAVILRKILQNQANVIRGNLTYSITGGGGGGTWGSITGTLSDQTDLQAALDAKPDYAIPTELSGTTELVRGPFPLQSAYTYFENLSGPITFTDSAGVPNNGHGHRVTLIGDGSTRTITIPSSFSENAGSNITSFDVPANGVVTIVRQYIDGAWYIWGDPVADVTAASSGKMVTFISCIDSVTLTNLSASTIFMGNSNRYVLAQDLTNCTQVRFNLRIDGTAGNAGSKLVLKYYTSRSATPGDYLDIGTSEVSIALNGATTTSFNTSWIDLAAGAMDDVFIALISTGGNGAVSPVLIGIMAEFR